VELIKAEALKIKEISHCQVSLPNWLWRISLSPPNHLAYATCSPPHLILFLSFPLSLPPSRTGLFLLPFLFLLLPLFPPFFFTHSPNNPAPTPLPLFFSFLPFFPSPLFLLPSLSTISLSPHPLQTQPVPIPFPSLLSTSPTRTPKRDRSREIITVRDAGLVVEEEKLKGKKTGISAMGEKSRNQVRIRTPLCDFLTPV
jgi:hypothetical protein